MNNKAYETGYTDYILWGEQAINPWDDADPQEMAEWLEGFYTALGEGVSYQYWESIE